MFHPQQTSYTTFSSYPQIPNPNPNFNLLFPQPVIPSDLPSEPVLHPPGTDPYAPPSSYPSIHGGFEGQTPHYEDPNAASQCWVVNQADPIGDTSGSVATTATNFSNEQSINSTSLNSLQSNWMNQPLVNAVTNTVPKQTKIIQSMRCEVCNIDCNTKDVFEKHIAGKKHKRKSQIHNNPTAIILGASAVAAGELLETKRQKLMFGGAAVDSVRTCTICNVVCNSQEVFNTHLAGKKHSAQAGIRPINGIANPNSVFLTPPTVKPQGSGRVPKKTKVIQFAWCEVCKIYCNSDDILIKHNLGKKHQKNVKELEKPKKDTSTAPSIDALVTTNSIIGPTENPETDKGKSAVEPHVNCTLEGSSKQTKVVQYAWCEVCKIYCNNDEILMKHKLGKKHQQKLKQLEKSKKDTIAPASTAAPVTTNSTSGLMQNPESDQSKSVDLKKKQASLSQMPEEDLETKKRKIMESGTAAGDVRMCIICNVVCNSQAVFNSHLAGHKHAAMVKKQAQDRLTTAGPQVISTS